MDTGWLPKPGQHALEPDEFNLGKWRAVMCLAAEGGDGFTDVMRIESFLREYANG